GERSQGVEGPAAVSPPGTRPNTRRQGAMNLKLLPPHDDDLIRLLCEGAASRRGEDGAGDPLESLLGSQCYSHKVLLSLERCQSIDTSGLSWLMLSHKRFLGAGGKLVLHAVPPVVLSVLNLLRLTPLLNVAPGEAAASEMALARRPDAPPAGGL